MSETGRTYGRSFKGHPVIAGEARAWIRLRTDHPDAVLVGHELFIAVLASGSDSIEIQLSTAGDRLRITATGTHPLPLRHSHGPGWRIISGLSRSTGITTDEHGLWAQMEEA